MTWALHEEKAFGAALCRLKGTSLVCWQHQGLAALAKAIVLPEEFSTLQDWPSDCYNMIWQLNRSNPTVPWCFKSYHITDHGKLKLHSSETARLPL